MINTCLPHAQARSSRYEYSRSSKPLCKEEMGSLKYTGRHTLERSLPILSLIIAHKLTPLSFSFGSGSFFRLSTCGYPKPTISIELLGNSSKFGTDSARSAQEFTESSRDVLDDEHKDSEPRNSFVSKKIVSSSSDSTSTPAEASLSSSISDSLSPTKQGAS